MIVPNRLFTFHWNRTCFEIVNNCPDDLQKMLSRNSLHPHTRFSTRLLRTATGVQNPSEPAAVVSFREYSRDMVRWESWSLHWSDGVFTLPKGVLYGDNHSHYPSQTFSARLPVWETWPPPSAWRLPFFLEVREWVGALIFKMWQFQAKYLVELSPNGWRNSYYNYMPCCIFSFNKRRG